MKITVVGGGKVGYYLIKTLLEHGHEPTVIEKDKKTCSFIANNLDIPIICGDGTSLEVLTASKLGESDAIVCVSGQDEINLVACQLARKIFDIKKTVARVNNPKNKDAMAQLGVDIVISSTDRIAEMLEREVDTSKIKEILSISHGAGCISQIDIPDDYELNGITLQELKLPESINIVSITRKDKLIIPRGSTTLKGGDQLLVIAENTSIAKMYSIFKI